MARAGSPMNVCLLRECDSTRTLSVNGRALVGADSVAVKTAESQDGDSVFFLGTLVLVHTTWVTQRITVRVGG